MKLCKNSAIRLRGPIIIILIAFIISGFIYLFKINQYKNWTVTPGIVLEIEQYGGGSSGHFGSSRSHRIYYSYTLNGKIYNGNNAYSGFNSNFAEGDSTDVWYNPDNPSESSFHKPGPALDPYVPLFIAVPLVTFAFRPTTDRRRK